DSSLSAGDRLLLHFGAVDWQCTIWVNGQELGSHTGGNDPFSFDISGVVKKGENELIVRVFDPTDEGYQPKGKQVLKPHGIMYTAVTGIWQTVWLETVPNDHIKSLKIVPDLDSESVRVTVDATVLRKAEFIASYNGKVVARKIAMTGSPVTLNISNPKVWGPGHPELYDLEVKLLAGQNPIDSVKSYFGMRKIEVKKDDAGINRLFLNGQPLFQYGPLDQGWWPDGLYTAPTEEAMIYDILVTQQFGMNMIRKHVKYEPARWYYACDKLGMLVWQDMPGGETGRSQKAKDNYMNELKAMVDTLGNFPSIVMWIPFNEGWGQHDTIEVVGWLEGYDPTRPINEASGWNDHGSGTVSDMHNYPGPGTRPTEEHRVCVLGEFGGLGMPAKGHLWQEDRNWGYVSYQNSKDLTDAYVLLLEKMRPLITQGLSAAVYTQTTDVEIEVNGLMTYDRQLIKIDPDRAAAAAGKLYGPTPRVVEVLPTSDSAKKQWSYTFSMPASDWYMDSFDDSAWKTGLAGFGDGQYPSMRQGTEWAGTDIWMRKQFTIDAPIDQDARLVVNIKHDDGAEVYLNGVKLIAVKGASSEYVMQYPDFDAVKLLKKGKNLIAVHCTEDGGEQFIDAGLTLLVEP
ncbi:MAG: hypothetical protein JW745_01900, partial [Sedimentisphaerales bacterium]|nr:hypothetical protein [Sedimentisphaerales bacterium]